MKGYVGDISLHIIERFLPALYYWMITIGSSFVLDRLNWPDLHKFLGFGWPLPILK